MPELGTERRAGVFELFERAPAERATGKRVLLLPGGFCTALSFIDLVAEPALADAGITTLAANPPGFRTNTPPDGFTCSTTEYAELVEALADAENLDLLVGHSLGANILIEVAARGNYVGPVVLLGPCLRVKNEYRGVRVLRRLEFAPPLARRAYRSMSADLHRSMAGLIRPDRLDVIVEDMQLTPPEQNRAVINGYFDHLEKYGTLAARLADASGAIHYVRGDAESVGFDRDDIRRIVAQENIETHTITNSDHFTMLDNPPEVAAVIVGALER
ncbi:MAG: alpha/beta hydrolase [Solirubrobacteraceae bacterium]|nr:alpha/beta hydrolase [Solirubrobacteraceae bacterium]